MNDREIIVKRTTTTFGNMPGDEMNLEATQPAGNMPGDEMDAKTGRLLVLFAEGASDEGAKILSDRVGLSVSVASESSTGEINPNQANSTALIYPKLGVAVVSAYPDQENKISSAANASNSPILAMEEEQIIDIGRPIISSQQVDDASDATWGLFATKVIDSQFSGQGIKVAILDTGLDLNHPDFAGRNITSKSFVPGEDVQDEYGHGTHCAGTACGSRQPTKLPRYGIAYEAEIYIAKVLNNKGSGTDQSILDGMEWAFTNGCQIISMSLGSLVAVGASYSSIYEIVAQRLLKDGTLIVAAAGNDSRRNMKLLNPVSRPANCPSIMAVGAVSTLAKPFAEQSIASKFQIANFSNRKLNKDGGEVDIAGPGVDVYSSWPFSKLPRQYNTINGTSMATPHVAGIAALFAQATNARGQKLWDLLINNAKRLEGLEEVDVGAGLVQAP